MFRGRCVVVLALLSVGVLVASPVPDRVPPSVLQYLQDLLFLPIPLEGEVASGLVDLPIREAQAEYGLAATGVLDAATLEAFSRVRCGVSPGFLALGGPRRRRRFATMGSRWRIAVVSYKISRYPDEVGASVFDQVVEDAMRAIAFVTRVRFRRAGVLDSSWNIDISFASDAHGCTANFSRYTLGHAFAPLEGADIHLRGNLSWSDYNVTYIFAHELLHSLGVDHSTNLGALMYPSYHKPIPGVGMLHSDDIAALQMLYGPPL